jgi:hypothetical protein
MGRRLPDAGVLGCINAAVACIERFARQADGRDVDLLLFSERYLQGYLVEQAHMPSHALDLRSGRFAQVLRRLTCDRCPARLGSRTAMIAPTGISDSDHSSGGRYDHR